MLFGKPTRNRPVNQFILSFNHEPSLSAPLLRIILFFFHSSKPVALRDGSTLLHGILRSPFPSSAVVSSFVRLQKLGNIGDERIIGIGVGQQRADTEEDFTDCQGWTPLVLQDVETNASVWIDVAVIDACGKVDLGRLKNERNGIQHERFKQNQ